MRRERKLNKAIQQDGMQTQSDILHELKRRYPQYVEQDKTAKQPAAKKRRIAVVSAFVATAACAAVIVPCAVLLPNHDDSGNGSGYRYCTQDEYSSKPSEYTIREYSETFDSKILYFDWYDTADDYYTNCYVSNDDGEILGFEEYMIYFQPYEQVYLYITKSNVYLSVLSQLVENSKMKKTIKNHTINWFINIDEASCMFENAGYRYIIYVPECQDENRLFELVEELLE